MCPLISFIIPIYNVENYLEECIDSILSQNLKYYEIILINDGSTDNSKNICDNYSKNHNNITTITTPNRGQSSARNLGIELAKGKYIAFIDSDDYYIPEVLKYFERTLEDFPNTDIIIGKIMIFYEDSDLVKPKLKYRHLNKIEGMTGEEGLDYLINTNQFLQSVYSYVVKRELVINNNISFNQEYKAYEDFDFTIRLFFVAKEVRAINEFFLMYRKNRVGQITYQGNLKRDVSALKVAINWESNVDDVDIKHTTKINVKKYLANKYLLWIANQSIYSKDEKKLRYEELKKGANLIQFSESNKRYLIIAKAIYLQLGFKSLVIYLTIIQKAYHKLKKLERLIKMKQGVINENQEYN